MSQKFIRKVEDFTCEKCGFGSEGNGFTNHCPECLWSKHVDKHPGDRAEECGGLMRPIGTEGTVAGYSLLYSVKYAVFRTRISKSPKDNFDEVLKIAKAKSQNNFKMKGILIVFCACEMNL